MRRKVMRSKSPTQRKVCGLEEQWRGELTDPNPKRKELFNISGVIERKVFSVLGDPSSRRSIYSLPPGGSGSLEIVKRCNLDSMCISPDMQSELANICKRISSDNFSTYLKHVSVMMVLFYLPFFYAYVCDSAQANEYFFPFFSSLYKYGFLDSLLPCVKQRLLFMVFKSISIIIIMVLENSDKKNHFLDALVGCGVYLCNALLTTMFFTFETSPSFMITLIESMHYVAVDFFIGKRLFCLSASERIIIFWNCSVEALIMNYCTSKGGFLRKLHDEQASEQRKIEKNIFSPRMRVSGVLELEKPEECLICREDVSGIVARGTWHTDGEWWNREKEHCIYFNGESFFKYKETSAYKKHSEETGGHHLNPLTNRSMNIDWVLVGPKVS